MGDQLKSRGRAKHHVALNMFRTRCGASGQAASTGAEGPLSGPSQTGHSKMVSWGRQSIHKQWLHLGIEEKNSPCGSGEHTFVHGAIYTCGFAGPAR